MLQRGGRCLRGSDGGAIVGGGLLGRGVGFALPVFWIVTAIAKILRVLGKTGGVVGDLG